MVNEELNRGKPTLRFLREKAGKTQFQVAVDVGVQPQAVGNWERGAVPHLDKAVLLAESLGISLEELCEAFGLRPPASQDKQNA
jgi:transcriptional regulator with XRE-family HTH domain